MAVSKVVEKQSMQEFKTYKNNTMDKCLTIFSDQLDAAFKPETLCPDKKFYIIGWLMRQLIIRKHRKKDLKENSTVNNTAKVEYV